MTDKQITQIARKLVKTSIQYHKKGKLGKKDMLTFFKEELNELYDSDYYNYIIMQYCSLLAQSGYEIMIDTDHFDIIDYNSYEYERYVDELLSKRPKNYNKLQEEAKLTAKKIIRLYKSKTYQDKSFKDYLEYTMPKTKYNSREKSIIEVNAIHFITHANYDINDTNPLVLSKFY